MKKYILSLVAITTILFSACKKDSNKPGDDNTTANYQPLTTGSTWTYRNETAAIPDLSDASIDTSVNTMTAATKVFNGKTFHQLTSVTGNETENSYLNVTDHIYYNHMVVDAAEAVLELPYLNDELAVNGTWLTPIIVADAPESRIKGTIVEKGITKVIQGKNYNNVIHTKLDLESKIEGTEFTSLFSFDFYMAKGVGVVAIYISHDDTQISKSELIAHTIK